MVARPAAPPAAGRPPRRRCAAACWTGRQPPRPACQQRGGVSRGVGGVRAPPRHGAAPLLSGEPARAGAGTQSRPPSASSREPAVRPPPSSKSRRRTSTAFEKVAEQSALVARKEGLAQCRTGKRSRPRAQWDWKRPPATARRGGAPSALGTYRSISQRMNWASRVFSSRGPRVESRGSTSAAPPIRRARQKKERLPKSRCRPGSAEEARWALVKSVCAAGFFRGRISSSNRRLWPSRLSRCSAARCCEARHCASVASRPCADTGLEA